MGEIPAKSFTVSFRFCYSDGPWLFVVFNAILFVVFFCGGCFFFFFLDYTSVCHPVGQIFCVLSLSPDTKASLNCQKVHCWEVSFRSSDFEIYESPLTCLPMFPSWPRAKSNITWAIFGSCYFSNKFLPESPSNSISPGLWNSHMVNFWMMDFHLKLPLFLEPHLV